MDLPLCSLFIMIWLEHGFSHHIWVNILILLEHLDYFLKLKLESNHFPFLLAISGDTVNHETDNDQSSDCDAVENHGLIVEDLADLLVVECLAGLHGQAFGVIIDDLSLRVKIRNAAF